MKRKILFLPLLLVAVMATAEMRLVVQPFKGAEQQYAISLIGQLRFAGKVMYLFDKQGTELGHTAVAEIGRIVFSDIPTALDNVQPLVSVYPNPAQESLTIGGLNGTQTVRIYDMQGQLMRAAEGNSQITINVGGLPDGAYLLQIGAETVKFIKE